MKEMGKQIAKEVMVQPSIRSNETKTPQTKRPEERSKKGETQNSSRTKEPVVTIFERKEKGSAETKPPTRAPVQPNQVGKDNRNETVESGKPPVGTKMLKKPTVKTIEEAKGKSEVLSKDNRKPNLELKTVAIMGDAGEMRNDAQALGSKEPTQKPTLASIVATKISNAGPIKTEPPEIGDWSIMVRGEKMDAKKIAMQWERQERLLRVLEQWGQPANRMSSRPLEAREREPNDQKGPRKNTRSLQKPRETRPTKAKEAKAPKAKELKIVGI